MTRVAATEDSVVKTLQDWLGDQLEYDQPDITQEIAANAWEAWKHISETAGSRLPEPCAGTVDTGLVVFCWNTKQDHLSLDLNPDGELEWFYADRRNESYLYDNEWTIGSPLPAWVIEKFPLFYRTEH